MYVGSDYQGCRLAEVPHYASLLTWSLELLVSVSNQGSDEPVHQGLRTYLLPNIGPDVWRMASSLGWLTPGRPQSKTLNNRRTRIKIAFNSVFDCHLSPVRRLIAIKNSVLAIFFDLRSSIVLTLSIAAYLACG